LQKIIYLIYCFLIVYQIIHELKLFKFEILGSFLRFGNFKVTPYEALNNYHSFQLKSDSISLWLLSLLFGNETWPFLPAASQL